MRWTDQKYPIPRLVTALLLLLAFPALQAAAIFRLMDRVAGTSFFSGGGPSLLWPYLLYAAFLLPALQLLFIRNLARSLSPGQVAKISDSPSRGEVWLFLASDAMLFASLFSGYVMLRAGAVTWPARFSGFPWLETLLLVGASAAFGATRIRLIASHALGLTFVVIRLATDASAIGNGLLPANNLMLASWYTLAWVHAFHVLAGAVFTGWLAGPSFAMAEDDPDRFGARIEATRKYWLFVDVVWLLIVIGFYVWP